MPRLNEARRNELEAFWRAHLEGWPASHLNQREYFDPAWPAAEAVWQLAGEVGRRRSGLTGGCCIVEVEALAIWPAIWLTGKRGHLDRVSSHGAGHA